MKIISTEIKNLDTVKTIAFSHTGEYSGITKVFEKLAAWATSTNYWANAPRMAGVYHDDPCHTPTDRLRSHACLEEKGSSIVLGEGMERYEITGGKYFIMTAEVKMADYDEAWKKAYHLLMEQGFECDTRDHYELYISCADATQGDDAPWVVEFRIPVK